MKKLATIILLSFIVTLSNAQWECRSKIGASLRPLGTSPFSVGNELITSTGYLNNSLIHNTMVFGSFDFLKQNHNIYVEGGYKFWYRTQYNMPLRDNNDPLNTDTVNFTSYTNRFGLREAFYRYQNSKTRLVTGLQSVKLNDHFLVNERMIGVSLNQKVGSFEVNVTGGTVSRDYARNGSFCSVRYLYDIFPDRKIAPMGVGLGQTNFGSASLTWFPGRKSSSVSTAGADEFATDEFADGKVDDKRSLKLESVGAIAYLEQGDMITTLTNDSTIKAIQPILVGGFLTLNLFNILDLKTEALLQMAESNLGAVVFASLGKDYILRCGNKLGFETKYYHFFESDSGARPLMSFTNLFLGEVVRLDGIDMPLWQVHAKYSMTKQKLHFKVQYVGQVNDSKLRETDIEIGKMFFSKLLVNLQLGYIESSVPFDSNTDNTKNTYISRIELRYNF